VPRRLPRHSHELPFFGLLLGGFYGEKYGREHKSHFTRAFRNITGMTPQAFRATLQVAQAQACVTKLP
jgi:Bacterial regulatory helix-turn-helix proteins, AraC family